MAKINNKTAVVGLGVLGVAGLAGAAFAASISVPPSNAGQGENVSQGFTVTNVEYDSDNLDGSAVTEAKVTDVEFDIDRNTQTLTVDDANASVFVQLRNGTTNSNWVECVTTAGHSECDTSSANDSIEIQSISDISIVAYDDLD